MKALKKKALAFLLLLMLTVLMGGAGTAKAETVNVGNGSGFVYLPDGKKLVYGSDEIAFSESMVAKLESGYYALVVLGKDLSYIYDRYIYVYAIPSDVSIDTQGIKSIGVCEGDFFNCMLLNDVNESCDGVTYYTEAWYYDINDGDMRQFSAFAEKTYKASSKLSMGWYGGEILYSPLDVYEIGTAYAGTYPFGGTGTKIYDGDYYITENLYKYLTYADGVSAAWDMERTGTDFEGCPETGASGHILLRSEKDGGEISSYSLYSFTGELQPYVVKTEEGKAKIYFNGSDMTLYRYYLNASNGSTSWSSWGQYSLDYDIWGYNTYIVYSDFTIWCESEAENVFAPCTYKEAPTPTPEPTPGSSSSSGSTGSGSSSSGSSSGSSGNINTDIGGSARPGGAMDFIITLLAMVWTDLCGIEMDIDGYKVSFQQIIIYGLLASGIVGLIAKFVHKGE